MWLKRAYPTTPDAEKYLLCVPGELVTIVNGFLFSLCQREQWNTRDDWEHGAEAIKEILATMSCVSEITSRLDRINAALGYDAGLPDDDPSYDAADTQKAHLYSLITNIQDRMGYESGGEIETSLAAIEAKIEDASDEELAAILQAILAML